ncbi:MAG: bifunctional riboflavin kinase/FAD synthetase [Candidatus Eisenbacteria bacterium]|nr:bifunctional riboflavin kinase/FAD synthetase [Candidatus Eisenbacteria bacterium]
MARETVKGSVATVGVFDGVHLGHVKILEVVSSRARELGLAAAVLTFDPHPDEVLGKLDTTRFLLTTRREKELLLANLGIDAAMIVEFTPALARLDTIGFVQKYLLSSLGLKELVVGHDFRMGKDRAGDRALLSSLGARFGFSVIDVEAVLVDGTPVSSTRVREAVATGDMDAAAKLLGRSYSLEGTVVKGEGIGRSLGFPTVNLSVHEKKLLPPDGVYAGYAEVRGRVLRAAINIGLRPTIAGGTRLVEAHIIGFEENIVGESVTLTFVVRMRPERKFANRDELRQAIRSDVDKIAYLLEQQ